MGRARAPCVRSSDREPLERHALWRQVPSRVASMGLLGSKDQRLMPVTKLRLPQIVVTGLMCELGATTRTQELTTPLLRWAQRQRRWRPQRRLRTPIVE